MKTLVRRLVPGGALLFGVCVLLQSDALRERLAALVPGYPIAVFGAGALLAWRFHRSTVVLGLLVLALADRVLVGVAASGLRATVEGRATVDAIAVLLPVNLAAGAWMRERPLLARGGRARAVVITAQAVAVLVLVRTVAPSLAWLLARPLSTTLPERVGGLPQLGLVAFALAFVLIAAPLLRQATPVDAGRLWALVAALLGLTAGSGTSATVYFATGGLILIVALLEASYGLAYGDTLTGLPGRRALEEDLDRLGPRYAIAMVDLDYFKRFNDEYGHAFGDQLLRMVAARLGAVGGRARAFRYGGEEFVLVFPGQAVSDTMPHLEALRKGIEASRFVLRDPGRPKRKPDRPRDGAGGRRSIGVTVSIGVAGTDQRRAVRPMEVLEAADAALYRAKRRGRNRIST